MSELPPIFRDQRKIDAGHLKLLSIFHFVGAGLAMVGILFIVLHFAMFHFVLNDQKFWEQTKQTLPPREFFAMFKVLYVVFGLWFLISCILNVISGLFLSARKYRPFSLVVAAINCLHFPLGTVLGVFTIVVLVRDSVGELYETNQ